MTQWLSDRLGLVLPARSVLLKLSCFSKGYGGLATFSRDVGLCGKQMKLMLLHLSSLCTHVISSEPQNQVYSFLPETLFTSNSLSVSSIHLISSLKSICFWWGVYLPPHYGRMGLDSLVRVIRGWRRGCHFQRLLSAPTKTEVLNLGCTWITQAALENTGPWALTLPPH